MAASGITILIKSSFNRNGRCYHRDIDGKSWNSGMDNTYLFREVREDFTEEMRTETYILRSFRSTSRGKPFYPEGTAPARRNCTEVKKKSGAP